jgi:hypothetical protein
MKFGEDPDRNCGDYGAPDAVTVGAPEAAPAPVTASLQGVARVERTRARAGLPGLAYPGPSRSALPSSGI